MRELVTGLAKNATGRYMTGWPYKVGQVCVSTHAVIRPECRVDYDITLAAGQLRCAGDSFEFW